MKRLVVLMYHGLYADAAELARIDAEDRPYAVSVARFTAQLAAIRAAGIRVLDPRNLSQPEQSNHGVVISFDDGHGSNYQHAYPILQALQAQAAFFVTSDFIGQRAGFCAWPQLREMAAAGMTIGSHGRSHRFFDDFTAPEAKQELQSSRDQIATATGMAVTQISFPGGRYLPRDLLLGQELGYQLFHTSRIGSHGVAPLRPGSVLARLAIRQQTSVATVLKMAGADAGWLLSAQGVDFAKSGLRQLLGNQRYHQLYQRMHRGR